MPNRVDVPLVQAGRGYQILVKPTPPTRHPPKWLDGTDCCLCTRICKNEERNNQRALHRPSRSLRGDKFIARFIGLANLY